MGLNVGELFISLGVQGSEKTIGAITGVTQGMGGLASTSLEAKAAILGAMYGLERLMSASAQMGTGLTNFNALTGMSTRQLQQWQYAARQAGVSGEEMTGSLKSVQGAMTNMLLGKGAPAGLGMLAQKVGFDTSRARDTFYVMEQLQKFAKSAPADIGNNVLKSFGIGEGTIAAMRRGVFNDKNFSKAPVFGEKEIASLDRGNIAWSNLGQKIEMAVGHFNAAHGEQLVNDISKIVDQVLKLTNALVKLSEQLKVFQVLEKAIGLSASLINVTSTGVSAVSGAVHDPSKRLPFAEDTAENMYKGFKVFIQTMAASAIAVSDMIAPPTAAQGSPGPTQTNHVSIQQTFQHDGKDHKQVGDSVKKAVKDAHRQIGAQMVGA